MDLMEKGRQEDIVSSAKSLIGSDFNIQGDESNVCIKCAKTIYQKSGIPFPATNSVVTFMDAIEGNKVDLFDNPKDINGNRITQRYEGRNDWDVLVSAGSVRAGDIMVVQNMEGGLHATVVTKIDGSPDDMGFFDGYFTGVDVIHDRGANSPVGSSHYEWYEINEGQGGDKGPNRKFVKAYRYKGSKVR
ncbi:MAG: hypothetical protein Unbinned4409contig1002_46 [Prokaryotic dsDNA virus sp.]|nr:MAG: hypothetical protein Unbinned4409contig1002_46 [Prokaryotic dsDNA virus sp.]|tara:strand:+ start:5751 stop:6317 length:567 start_codon:yes stop_codon:yes gene_type:complete